MPNPHDSPCPHQVAWLAGNVGQQSAKGGVLSQAAPRQACQLVLNGLRALGGQALKLLGGDQTLQAGRQARAARWRHPARQRRDCAAAQGIGARLRGSRVGRGVNQSA